MERGATGEVGEAAARRAAQETRVAPVPATTRPLPTAAVSALDLLPTALSATPSLAPVCFSLGGGGRDRGGGGGVGVVVWLSLIHI